MKRLPPPQASFAELFTPKPVTTLREECALKDLRADAVAGLMVAIVALPLSMAIAIACGVSPDRGLCAAIVLSGAGPQFLGYCSWRAPSPRGRRLRHRRRRRGWRTAPSAAATKRCTASCSGSCVGSLNALPNSATVRPRRNAFDSLELGWAVMRGPAPRHCGAVA